MEEDFFITEYMSRGRDELKCTIKKLYSDFIVNEITPNGTVLSKFTPHCLIIVYYYVCTVAYGVIFCIYFELLILCDW